MADKKKKSNTEKALGQDPFEGLFGPEWEDITGETTAAESTTETEQSIQTSEALDETGPELEAPAENITEIDQIFEALAVAKETVAPVEDDAETEPELETTPESEAKIEQAFEALVAPAELEAKTEPVAIAEAEDAQTSEATDAEDELEPELKAIAEINADEIDQALEALAVAKEPEVEVEPVVAVESEDTQDIESSDAEEAKENLVFDETPGVLDEIIASIDEEIEQSHETDLMATLQTEASGSRNENLEQYIIFTLAGAMYAAPAANVREVGEMASLTPVPNVPDWLMGVTNLRGDVLSVVDLHTFLSLEQSDYIESLSEGAVSFSGEQEVLVVHPREDASLITTGLVVDEVNDIRYLTTDRITTPAAPIEDQVGSYLRGVYEDEDHLLVVLDFERLLLSPEMRQFELL